jgi:hypothetical protein
MNGLMLNSAEVLSSERAGGHGDRWGVFVGGTDAIMSSLQTIVQNAEWFDSDVVEKDAIQPLIAAGEPKCILLLHTGQAKGVSKTGAMSLNVVNQANKHIELWSAYPFFGDGVEVDGIVDRLLLHPNRVEATLEIGLASGAILRAFDPLFCLHRALYRTGEAYRFSVSALSYTIEPAPQREYVIDDPDKIRRFRASDAWAGEHGRYAKEDEAAALTAWHPESPEDLEPIRIDARKATMLWPTGFSDDSGYMGEVVRVTPNAVRMLDTSFWRVDVALIRDEGVNLAVPIYVASDQFKGEWRPSVGEYVTGGLWMQAYVKPVR